MKRLWEVDFSRGIAIVLMIVFNWFYTLRHFGIYSVGGGQLYWLFFPRFIAGMFIFIMGLSLALNYSSLKTKKFVYINNIKRGLKIFFLGMMITLATWVLFPESFILFGILHFMGISIILATPFLNKNKYALLAGLSTIFLGVFLNGYRFDFPWLMWLGFVPSSLTTFDYFPLLPWFGVALLGMYFGKRFYSRRPKIPDFSKVFLVRFVSILGRNSLVIYLLHQPLLILILHLIGYSLF